MAKFSFLRCHQFLIYNFLIFQENLQVAEKSRNSNTKAKEQKYVALSLRIARPKKDAEAYESGDLLETFLFSDNSGSLRVNSSYKRQRLEEKIVFSKTLAQKRVETRCNLRLDFSKQIRTATKLKDDPQLYQLSLNVTNTNTIE